MSDEIEPDYIETSGRESMTTDLRIAYLEQDLLWLRMPGRAPTFDPKSKATTGASVHDFVGMTSFADSLCEQYRKYGVVRVEPYLLSYAECLVIAWKRGGHEEQRRVSKEFYRRKNERTGR